MGWGDSFLAPNAEPVLICTHCFYLISYSSLPHMSVAPLCCLISISIKAHLMFFVESFLLSLIPHPPLAKVLFLCSPKAKPLESYLPTCFLSHILFSPPASLGLCPVLPPNQCLSKSPTIPHCQTQWFLSCLHLTRAFSSFYHSWALPLSSNSPLCCFTQSPWWLLLPYF